MNPVGREAQKKGKLAEQRVKDLATRLELPWSYSVEDDYKHGIDITIRGVKFQVSATGKSNPSARSYLKNGIYCIEAGEHLTDAEVIQQITYWLNYEA